VIGVCGAVWSFIIYPITIASASVRLQLRFGILLLVPLLVYMPFISAFQRREGGLGDWRLWVVLVLVSVSVQTGIAIGFTATFMINNNSVPTAKRVRLP